eukprot:3939975-Amphidinium_carterae.2
MKGLTSTEFVKREKIRPDKKESGPTTWASLLRATPAPAQSTRPQLVADDASEEAYTPSEIEEWVDNSGEDDPHQWAQDQADFDFDWLSAGIDDEWCEEAMDLDTRPDRGAKRGHEPATERPAKRGHLVPASSASTFAAALSRSDGRASPLIGEAMAQLQSENACLRSQISELTQQLKQQQQQWLPPPQQLEPSLRGVIEVPDDGELEVVATETDSVSRESARGSTCIASMPLTLVRIFELATPSSVLDCTGIARRNS